MKSSSQPTDLWRWSATALRDAIATKEVSAVEVAQAHIDRSEAVNSTINAVVTTSYDEALERAREVDNGDGGAPLSGVPITIKDNVDQAGQVNTNGVVAFANNLSTGDSALVGALRDGGAVMLGRTNVPTFSMRWFSENALYGRTLNPWSPDHTPGGSSGGAAAAVAAGIVPISHGNDIGGSIRYPAGVNGVVGIRPTVGRISKWSPPSVASFMPYPSDVLMVADGPIARHVTDLRLALGVMSRTDLRDPAALPAPYVDEEPLPRGSKIGVVFELPDTPSSSEVVRALETAVSHLTDAGYQVVETDLPELSEAHRIWQLLVMADVRLDFDQMVELADDQLRISLQHQITYMEEIWGSEWDLPTYIKGHIRRNALVAAMEQHFAEVPLLLTPLSAQAQPRHGADYESYESATLLVRNQWPMTFVPCLGLPGVSVPIAVDDGLPTSVQLVSGRFRESWILDAAQAIEDRAGTLTPIDPVRPVEASA